MEDILKRVIALAKLEFDKKELEDFIKECENISKHFQKIKELKTEKGLYHLYQEGCPLREDKIKIFKSVLKKGYFKVKKVL